LQSSDQKERDLEITRVVWQKMATDDLYALKKQNKAFDTSSYERELLNIKIRLGFVNNKSVQSHKL